MIYRTGYNNFICYVLIEPSLYLRKPIELIFVGLKNSYIFLYLRKWVDLSRINAKLSRLDKRVTFHARIKRGSGGRVGEKSSFLNLHCKISKNMTPPPPANFKYRSDRSTIYSEKVFWIRGWLLRDEKRFISNKNH